MQMWCMAHPWMTLFLVTLLILVVGLVVIVKVAVSSKREVDTEKCEKEELD